MHSIRRALSAGTAHFAARRCRALQGARLQGRKFLSQPHGTVSGCFHLTSRSRCFGIRNYRKFQSLPPLPPFPPAVKLFQENDLPRSSARAFMQGSVPPRAAGKRITPSPGHRLVPQATHHISPTPPPPHLQTQFVIFIITPMTSRIGK